MITATGLRNNEDALDLKGEMFFFVTFIFIAIPRNPNEFFKLSL